MPMPCRTTIAIFPLLVSLLAPGLGHAAGNAGAKVLLHLSDPVLAGRCSGPQSHPACQDVDTSGDLYPTHTYYAYVLVADADPVEGVAGLIFGIDYDNGTGDGSGVDVFSWTLCATLELGIPSPVWPAPGSSNRIFWDTTTRCQVNEPGGPGTGVVAPGGYFYCGAYSPGSFRIRHATTSSSSENNRVTLYGCSQAIDVIYDLSNPPIPSTLGWIRFSGAGNEPGYNPCAAAIPVESVTWGRIKSSFD